MLPAIGALFIIAALVAHVIVVYHAFKDSLIWGLACLCIPCVSLFYMFFKFEHENKTLIVLLYLFGGAIGGALHGYSFFHLWGPWFGWGHHHH